MASISIATVGMNSQPVAPGPVSGATADPVMVVNLDEVNTVYLGSSANQVVLPLGPVASVTLAPPVWASAPVPVTVGVIPGGIAWANPVGVQVALDALGLATADLQNTQMATGIPPNVPNVASANTINGTPTASPVTVFTMPSAGRLWGVNMSGSCSASSGYAGGNDRFYCLAQTSSGIVLATIEQALNEMGQSQSDSVYVPFNGLDIPTGTKLELIINGGTNIGGVEVIASVVFFYSIP